MSMTAGTLTPSIHVPEDLRDVVSTTFTHSCAYGCTVRVVEGSEQPHVCVGEQVIAALAPELPLATAKKIAAGLQPLVRELSGEAWETGVGDGRGGKQFAGLDD